MEDHDVMTPPDHSQDGIASDTRELYAGIHERQLVEGTTSRLPGYLDLIDLDVRGLTCLDVGAGSTARDAIRLFEAGAAFVTLVDVGRDWMFTAGRELKRHGVAAECFALVDVRDWVTAEESMQVGFVACNGVLHHVENEQETLRAIARDLAPDAHLYLMVMGKGGLVRDFVMHFLRDRYVDDPSFKAFMESSPEVMAQGAHDTLSALLTERNRPLAEPYSALLNALSQGLDIDFMMSLKDRVNSPIYREYSMDDAERALSLVGLSVVQRVYPAPEFENIRSILEPVYAHPHRATSAALMGGGNLHLLARKGGQRSALT